ncbi:MAG TPA: hypothetical protein VHJ78_05605 [Actinomycetota bacterium]|nr:hypothetical protein [Actinomycetota bacterium]
MDLAEDRDHRYADALLDREIRRSLHAEFDDAAPPEGTFRKVLSAIQSTNMPAGRAQRCSFKGASPLVERAYRAVTGPRAAYVMRGGVAMVLLLMAIGMNASQMLRNELDAPDYVMLPTPTSQLGQGRESLGSETSAPVGAIVEGAPGTSYEVPSGRADLHTYDPVDLRRPAAKRDAWIRILNHEPVEQNRRASGF